MKLDEAAQYQDALDAVEAGTANSVQMVEALAVAAEVNHYLAIIADKVSGFRAGVRALKTSLSEERWKALSEAIDGKDVLSAPRIGEWEKIDTAKE